MFRWSYTLKLESNQIKIIKMVETEMMSMEV